MHASEASTKRIAQESKATENASVKPEGAKRPRMPVRRTKGPVG